jgi:hypothetical protein
MCRLLPAVLDFDFKETQVCDKMTKYVESKTRVFKKKEPLTEEDMKRLLITGGSGAFREIIREGGQDPAAQVYMGTVVHCNSQGVILGSRLVKCGTIHGQTLNGEEIWEGCRFPTKIIVEDHEASLYEDPNGMLTSNWTMNIPWKVKVKIEGKWKSVKKGALKEFGLNELAFRMNFQPVSDQGGKAYIGVVPVGVEELKARGDAGSRFFPTVKVLESRSVLWPQEEPHHMFGLGVQPLLLLQDGVMDQEGYMDTEGVIWPTSQQVKDAQGALLQSSTMPNYHMTVERWREAVDKGDYERRESTLKWPSPRQEDGESEDSNLEDTDGE